MSGADKLILLGIIAALCVWMWIVATDSFAMPNIRSLWTPPDYKESSGFKAAEKWLSEQTAPDDTEGFDKGLEYAWKRYDQVSSASETLDKKADNLMRNAGLVAGLLGVVMNTLKVVDPRFLAPSLGAFVLSLICAAIACNPTGGATSASVDDVVDDIRKGHASDFWIAGSLHLAIVGRTCLNNWKADRIRWSTTLFCIGLALLVLPVFGLF